MILLIVLINFGLGLTIGTLVSPESSWFQWASVLYLWVAGYLTGEVGFSHRHRIPWSLNPLRSKSRIIGVRKKREQTENLPLRGPAQ